MKPLDWPAVPLTFRNLPAGLLQNLRKVLFIPKSRKVFPKSRDKTHQRVRDVIGERLTVFVEQPAMSQALHSSPMFEAAGTLGRRRRVYDHLSQSKRDVSFFPLRAFY